MSLCSEVELPWRNPFLVVKLNPMIDRVLFPDWSCLWFLAVYDSFPVVWRGRDTDNVTPVQVLPPVRDRSQSVGQHPVLDRVRLSANRGPVRSTHQQRTVSLILCTYREKYHRYLSPFYLFFKAEDINNILIEY